MMSTQHLALPSIRNLHAFKRMVRAAVIGAAAMLLAIVQVHAQTEPEAPRTPEVPFNGWQLGGFLGASYNVFSGGYYDEGCKCSFLANATSTNAPFGVSLNVPVFSDASLYLRAGWQRTQTTFFTGRIDSLRSTLGSGDIGDEFTLYYTMLQLDILIRLIGKQDGERVFFGPSFGIVRNKRTRVVETEYATGKQYLLTDTDFEAAHAVRRSFVIGVEYAIVPYKWLYIIPSLQVDYAMEKMSSIQPLRPTFYKFLVSVSYQPF